jgi:hypothetical protein
MSEESVLQSPKLAEASFVEIVNELGRRFTSAVVGVSAVMPEQGDNREQVMSLHRGNHSHCVGLWAVGHTRILSAYDEINEVRINRESQAQQDSDEN